MKKNFKRKILLPSHEDEPVIAEMIIKIQQQLNVLDKKMDAIIGQSQGTPFKAEHTKPFQRFEHPQRHNERRPDNNFRDRVLHKAICADCRKECEVPFKPSQDRPVYCKDCFSKRKGGSSFKGNADNRPREERPFHASHADKPHVDGKKKFFGKKHASVKKRKARG